MASAPLKWFIKTLNKSPLSPSQVKNENILKLVLDTKIVNDFTKNWETD